jgi:hypothetical protein
MKMPLIAIPILAATALALCADAPPVASFYTFVEQFRTGMNEWEVKSNDGETAIEGIDGAGLHLVVVKRNGKELVNIYVDGETNNVDYIVVVEDANADPIISRSINAKGEITAVMEQPRVGQPKLIWPNKALNPPSVK